MAEERAEGEELPNEKSTNGNVISGWQLKREKILMFCGILLIMYEAAFADLLGDHFHYEIVLAGLALCGVSIAQWGDKK